LLPYSSYQQGETRILLSLSLSSRYLEESFLNKCTTKSKEKQHKIPQRKMDPRTQECLQSFPILFQDEEITNERKRLREWKFQQHNSIKILGPLESERAPLFIDLREPLLSYINGQD
jgi:hypothetical protein